MGSVRRVLDEHGRLVGVVVSNGYELSTSPRMLDSASEVSDDWNARIGASGYGESAGGFPAALPTAARRCASFLMVWRLTHG
jgi:hypothetical protein